MIMHGEVILVTAQIPNFASRLEEIPSAPFVPMHVASISCMNFSRNIDFLCRHCNLEKRSRNSSPLALTPYA